MTNNNWPEVVKGLARVGGFLVVCILIYLLGTTEHWVMIPGCGILTTAFAYFASKGNKLWMYRCGGLGLLAGALWYIFGV